MHLVLFFYHFEFKNVNYKKDVNKNKETVFNTNKLMNAFSYK